MTGSAGTGKRPWLGPLLGVTVLGGVALSLGLQPNAVTTTLGKPAEPITHFLLAVGAILMVCHLLGALFRALGQPAVLGEIIGGLVLGPSLFGQLAPHARAWMFPKDVLSGLDTAAQLGLIVFLFLLGCELDVGRIGRKRVVGATVTGSIGLPFLAGIGVAVLAGDTMAVADAGDLSRLLARLGVALAYIVVIVLVVRPLTVVLLRRLTSDQAVAATLVVGVVGVAALAQQVGLHPMIGAFLFGAVLPANEAVSRVRTQLEGFAITILLPLFFAGVGLNTYVGLIGADVSHWLWFAVFLVVAVSSKMIGASGGARLSGLPKRESSQLGSLMNCRGITELVVATVGIQYGLINQYGFTVLVLVAVITSLATGVQMRRSLRQAQEEGMHRAAPLTSKPRHPVLTRR